MTTANQPSFKDLMAQMNKEAAAEAPTVKIEGKKKLDDRYNFNQGWYDALLNTEHNCDSTPMRSVRSSKSASTRVLLVVFGVIFTLITPNPALPRSIRSPEAQNTTRILRTTRNWKILS